MRFKKLVTILFVFTILVSCSESNDCFIADSVEKIKEININDTVYFLYLRISGFNEKEYFYELYGREPKFDNCGKAEAGPISNLHVDTSVGKPVKLIVKNEALSLRFSKNSNGVVDLKKISIEIKNH